MYIIIGKVKKSRNMYTLLAGCFLFSFSLTQNQIKFKILYTIVQKKQTNKRKRKKRGFSIII